jgi:hypothetical protein
MHAWPKPAVQEEGCVVDVAMAKPVSDEEPAKTPVAGRDRAGSEASPGVASLLVPPLPRSPLAS